MKKILSLMLALTMLVSMVAVASADDAAATTPVVPDFQTNVAVEIPAMATKPTFDGVINAAEWGDALVSLSAADAASNYTTEYSKNNSFVWWRGDETDREASYADELAYDLYFGWDKDYLYIAASMLDENGYWVNAGRDGMWEFDLLQVYVDIYGPNGIQANNDAEYDYTKTGFDWLEYTRPWSNASVPNLTAAKVNGVTRDMYQLYNVADGLMVASRKEDGTLNPATGYDTNGDIFVTPSAGGEGAKTVIEMAVPWEVVAYDYEGDAIVKEDGTSEVIGVGKTIGISTMFQNVPGNEGSYGSDETAFLCWGSGIVGAQYDTPGANNTNSESTLAEAATRNGGSNALILTNKGIDGAEVSGLPTYTEGVVTFEQRVLYAESGSDDYYSQTVNTVKDEFTATIDLAMLDYNINDPAYTAFGFVFGVDHYTDEEIAAFAAEKEMTVEEYIAQFSDGDPSDDFSIYAGFDFGTSKATISHWGVEEGMTTSDEEELEGFVYAQSDVIDWQVGGWNDDGSARQAEWKTMTVEFKDHTTKVYIDDKLAVEYTDETIDIAEEQVLLVYGTAERLIDNFSYSSGEASYSYTFDADDLAFRYGKDQDGLSRYDNVAFVCNDAENENLLGYTGHNEVEYAKPQSEMAGCLYCTAVDKEPTVIIDPVGLLGDINNDEIVNILDAIEIAKAVVGGTLGDISVAAGDVDANGMVNILDAIAIATTIVGG